MATRTIPVSGNGTGTLEFPLQGPDVLEIESVLAVIDAGGAGDTTVTLTVTSPAGNDVAAVPQGQPISGGGQGRATWALRLAEDGVGAPPAGLDTTDGVTNVSPTNELLIGAGLTLTQPVAGVAEIAAGAAPVSSACRFLKASAVGTVGSAVSGSDPGTTPFLAWQLLAGQQWSGETNDRTGSLAPFDAATDPTWTGTAFRVTHNGGASAIQLNPFCPNGLVFYSVRAQIQSYAAPPTVTEFTFGVEALDHHNFTPLGIDEMSIAEGFWGQDWGSWPFVRFDPTAPNGGPFAWATGAIVAPISPYHTFVRPNVMQSSGQIAQVAVELRLALLQNFGTP